MGVARNLILDELVPVTSYYSLSLVGEEGLLGYGLLEKLRRGSGDVRRWCGAQELERARANRVVL
jgi:hypothetical protein